MSRIFITGDTLGDYDVGKLYTRNFRIQSQLTKEDFLIIGDSADRVLCKSVFALPHSKKQSLSYGNPCDPLHISDFSWYAGGECIGFAYKVCKKEG